MSKNNKQDTSLKTVQRGDFDAAKGRIEQFSSKKQPALKIDQLDTSKQLFGMVDRKATTSEVNNITSEIKKSVAAIQKVQIETIGEFKQIYNAFDSLDKKYIAGIMGNLEATNFLANENKKIVNKTSLLAQDNQRTIARTEKLSQDNQKTIKTTQKLSEDNRVMAVNLQKNWEVLEKTTKKLVEFKQGLESIKHLTDVDSIWDVCNKIKSNMQILEKYCKDSLVNMEESILSQVEGSIDETIEQVNSVCSELNNALNQVNNELRNNMDILNKNLLAKVQQVSEEAKKDLNDSLTEVSTEIKATLTESTERLEAAHKDSNEAFDKKIISTKQEVENSINNLVKKQASNHEELVSENEKFVKELKDLDKKQASNHEELVSENEKFVKELKDLDEKQASNHEELVSKNEKLVKELKDLDEKQASNHEELISENEKLVSKLKLAYWVAGSAVFMSLADIIASVVGVYN